MGDRADYATDYWQADRLAIEITSVVGAVVYATMTDYWANGTVVNVNTYHGNISAGGLEFLYCANLQKGDKLYEGSTGKWFNDTFSMELAGETRTVNLLLQFGDHAYFDQATGILAKLVSLPGEWNYTMISTNMWGPGMVDPVALAIVGGIAAIATVVIVAAVKLKKAGKFGVAEPTFGPRRR
ncbi:MAG: hypothetical protein WED04_09705 [Promethearchaeati archaeon SRVP18_Atabeyarchaeia-1]